MRARKICWARKIDVTAAIPSATSSQPWAAHWRRASAIGSNPRGRLATSALLPRHRRVTDRREIDLGAPRSGGRGHEPAAAARTLEVAVGVGGVALPQENEALGDALQAGDEPPR